MTYFDPKIYNYNNLKKKDQLIIDDIMQFGFMPVVNSEYDLHYDLKSENTLSKMVAEIKLSALKEAEQHIVYDVIELIVSIIEKYEEQVEEKDCDYLDGCQVWEEYGANSDTD